ncbi:MAG: hypothetical protein GC182_10075 [Rhodopseudomonas sp.]|nr:hypothetical protein [Rhodopseudomonas sp.]
MTVPSFVPATAAPPPFRTFMGNAAPAKIAAPRIHHRIVRAPAKAVLWVRKGDARRFITAATILIAILSGLFFMLPAIRAHDAAVAMAKAKAAKALAESNAREAKARGIGSIVFSSNDRLCEEIQFDNRTGRTLAINQVDCESRLTPPVAVDPLASKASRMRDVMTSFGR